jgi:AcrR family transcriptional regulator
MKEAQAVKREYRMVARADATVATRERILDATEALFRNAIAGGLSLDFSLDEVASAAGTTVQTVLRHFGSKEHLIETAIRRGNERIGQERALAPVGDVPGAVRNLVVHYERYGELVLRMLAEEHRSSAMREVTDGGREIHREWVMRTFAPQLESVSGAARKRRMAQLVAVCDVFVWKLLRHDMKLGPRQLESALIELIEGLEAHR